MDYFTTSNSRNFNGYDVNTGSSSQLLNYTSILEGIHKRMEHMTDRFSRVLFVRFDLRFPYSYHPQHGNFEISRLCKIMMENSKNRGFTLHYFWVREQSREKHQHYHFIALLDGNKVQNHYGFLKEVERVWGMILGHDPTGLCDYCCRDRAGSPVENGILIRSPRRYASGEELEVQEKEFHETFNRCFYWASYLAKVNQKSNTPRGTRRFGGSAMK